MKKINILALALVIVFSSFLFVSPVFADEYQCTCVDTGAVSLVSDCTVCETKCKAGIGVIQNYTGEFKCVISSSSANNQQSPSELGTVKLTNPLPETDNFATLIGKIINAVLRIVGSVSLVMFIVGGLIWMTAAGNPEKVKKGRDVIIWTAIGLAVIFFSYAIIRFVLAALGVA